MVILNLRDDCVARTATNFRRGMTDKRFLELEILVPGEEQREAAVSRLLALLEELGIPRDRLSRRSYLELLAEKQREQGGGPDRRA